MALGSSRQHHGLARGDLTPLALEPLVPLGSPAPSPPRLAPSTCASCSVWLRCRRERRQRPFRAGQTNTVFDNGLMQVRTTQKHLSRPRRLTVINIPRLAELRPFSQRLCNAPAPKIFCLALYSSDLEIFGQEAASGHRIVIQYTSPRRLIRSDYSDASHPLVVCWQLDVGTKADPCYHDTHEQPPDPPVNQNSLT